MYCSSCGAALGPGAKFCTACGRSQGEGGLQASPARPAAPARAAQLPVTGQDARVAIDDALGTIRLLMRNPVEHIGRAFNPYLPSVLGAAIALAAVGAFLFVASLFFGLRSLDSLFGFGGMMGLGFGGDLSAGDWFKVFAVSFIPCLTMAAALAAARMGLGGTGRSFAGDLFVSAVALLPLGIAMVLAAILGPSVAEIVLALGIMALCTTVLVLHGGAKDVAGIAEPKATLAVPLVLLVAGWLSSVVLRALLL